MTDQFARCLEVILEHEGGDEITNDPLDPGGVTKWGISARAFPGVDIPNLTREQASEIYRQHYWDRVRGDEMPVGVDLCVFDSAVNQGSGTAVKCLQRAVGASADGVLGPATLARVRQMAAVDVIRRLQSERAHRYIGLGGFVTYGRGWINRVIAIAVTAAVWSAS